MPHSFVIRVAGPFHYYIGRDTKRKGIDNKGASAGMCSHQFPFRVDFVNTDIALVGCDADRIIDFGQFAQFLEIPIHRLIGVVRQGLIILERDVLVLIENSLGNVVQLNGDTIRRFDGRNLDVVPLDITSTKVVDIRVPET